MARGVAPSRPAQAAVLAGGLTLLEPVPGTAVVRAAGGVVWRPGLSGEVQVLVVHRPKYDDWTFPKGKCETDETAEACALREVEEETGYRCVLGPELVPTAYVDSKGRHKEVRYWVMTVDSGHFEPNDEVDDIRWLSVDQARAKLTYDRDRALADFFIRREHQE